ncbi:hypothetical protein [Trujillonella endophytica]|uniref:Polyketide cyclase / dehydrase and lipid transport n=1 Tax=Trujillonella endophytica TaxID=673521 RepID=A0A1H8VVR1_9ACTN|nr:hypothetical protein [Trujillella endophytica]SEP19327.1 hypothetical protein SAMN05660991_03806 [Trujillella endophytica]
MPPLEELPRIDEHAVTVAAPPGTAWRAVLTMLHTTFAAPAAAAAARVLGCEPATTSGWDRPTVGSTVPGFRIVAAAEPRLLVVAGRHRFSRYGIVVRLEPVDGEPGAGGTRVRLESRGAFPGAHGRLYRLAVVGTGGHALAVRRMLAGVRRAAEQRRS